MELRSMILPSSHPTRIPQSPHSQRVVVSSSHLVNEGGKLVVKGLDLLLLLALHLLNLRVNVNMDRPQKSWVNLHRLDASREPRATSHRATKAAYSSTNYTSSNAAKSSSIASTKANNSTSISTAIRATHGNPSAATHVMEASAAETSTASATSISPGCGE